MSLDRAGSVFEEDILLKKSFVFVILLILGVSFSLTSDTPAAAQDGGTTERVSVAGDGSQANRRSASLILMRSLWPATYWC